MKITRTNKFVTIISSSGWRSLASKLFRGFYGEKGVVEPKLVWPTLENREYKQTMTGEVDYNRIHDSHDHAPIIRQKVTRPQQQNYTKLMAVQLLSHVCTYIGKKELDFDVNNYVKWLAFYAEFWIETEKLCLKIF